MNNELAKQYFEEEYKRDILAYKLYYLALAEVFDFSLVKDFADVGCNSGGLIKYIAEDNEGINLLGIDYFEWARTYADPSIKDRIQLMDLSKPQIFENKYDLVNCSEVGEHIEREAEGVFIDNLLSLTKDVLVLSWSNDKLHDHDQHQNPRPHGYIINLLRQKGVSFWPEATSQLKSAIERNLVGIGHEWWAKNIMVFKRQSFANVAGSYLIQGINTDNASHHLNFRNANKSASFQREFMALAKSITVSSVLRKPLSVLRASDGDYYFLRRIPTGSARPGNRALLKGYNEINIDLFRRLFWQNDIVAINSEKQERNHWRSYLAYLVVERLFAKLRMAGSAGLEAGSFFYKVRRAADMYLVSIVGSRLISALAGWVIVLGKGNGYREKVSMIVRRKNMPAEAVYALVATKWIFKKFKNRIGLIGNQAKIELIRELMKRDEYRQYLGMDEFTDYIAVPQRGAVDDVEALAKEIGGQIKDSKAEIFLVGAGSAKIALMPLFKTYSNAIFIDVGCGLDAIAGVVCQERPYFADWINYRLSGYDYSKIDFLDQGSPYWNKPEYKTFNLN